MTGEALDVYLDDLEHLDGRIEIGPGDLFLRLNFYKGLSFGAA